MNKIMEVKDLKKSFKNKAVLKGLNFHIYENCITGFIGINGAGKTTFIKSVLGLVKPDAGEISVFGMPLREQAKTIKDRIGIVFDNGSLYEDLSIQDMKKIIASAYSHWDDALFFDYLDQFELNPKQKISTLSKGMRMKYAIALAISHHADLLIMDEPTSGLDPLVRKQMLEIMRDFVSQEGKSVFFSTHITTDLDKIADQIIMLDQGQIIFQEDKDILIENHALVQGKNQWLTEENKKLFLKIESREFHFEGITCQKDQVAQAMKEAVFTKPTVEDIMVGYLGGRRNV